MYSPVVCPIIKEFVYLKLLSFLHNIRTVIISRGNYFMNVRFKYVNDIKNLVF